MTWILTNSAIPFDLLNPKAESINPRDLAHALSMVCRFNGHCAFHYSVAQHSLLVAYIIEQEGGTPEEQLAGLLHDGTEAYISDLTRPLKLLLIEAARQRNKAWLDIVAQLGADSSAAGIKAGAGRILNTTEDDGLFLLLDVYQQIEERIWFAICEHFHLESELPACVKNADMIALATERRDLLPEHPAEWECLQGYAPMPEQIIRWKPDTIRQAFHLRLMDLLATTNRRRVAQ